VNILVKPSSDESRLSLLFVQGRVEISWFLRDPITRCRTSGPLYWGFWSSPLLHVHERPTASDLWKPL